MDNVQDFAQSALPPLGQIAGTLPLDPATLKGVHYGLTAAETAIGVAGVNT